MNNSYKGLYYYGVLDLWCCVLAFGVLYVYTSWREVRYDDNTSIFGFWYIFFVCIMYIYVNL